MLAVSLNPSRMLEQIQGSLFTFRYRKLDPAPAPVASKEPEKGKNYFGLYLLVGGRQPIYDMESDIETTDLSPENSSKNG